MCRFCLFWRNSPPVGLGLLIQEASRSYTTTHYSRQDNSGQVISPTQSPLPDNTQHSQHRETSLPPEGFEPTISAGELPQNYVLYRAATGTGKCLVKYPKTNFTLSDAGEDKAIPLQA
jgi:hypothetical protein